MTASSLADLGPAVPSTSLHSLPLIARGKVRDLYAVGADRMLMVASDRLSAFDVVMQAPVPGKGRLLTQMALFWFEKLHGIVPNHLTGEAPESVVAADEVAQVVGRSMLVRRLTPLPCVSRFASLTTNWFACSLARSTASRVLRCSSTRPADSPT